MEGTIGSFSSSQTFDRIGAGFCGTVWSAPGIDTETEFQHWCIKREDGGPHRSLQSEQILQTRVNERVAKSSESSFLVPHCYGYLPKADSAWRNLLSGFPSGYEPCNAMVSDTIQPISASARKEMIARYCPAEAQAQITADSNGTNRHCLLRLYLGRRRQPRQLSSRRRFFTLRNLPLHLDQVEELQLPTTEYARVMARGLAFMNWSCGIDGNDVEFVLAPPRAKPTSNAQRIWNSPVIGQHSMWLLDFDCCRELALADCVEQIAKSFWRNDPYFPRPNGESLTDQILWREFAEEYKSVSLEIMLTGPFGEKLGALLINPATLIDEVLKRIDENREEYIRG